MNSDYHDPWKLMLKYSDFCGRSIVRYDINIRSLIILVCATCICIDLYSFL